MGRKSLIDTDEVYRDRCRLAASGRVSPSILAERWNVNVRTVNRMANAWRDYAKKEES